mgnify:CR=1 FL=1
MPIVEQMQDGDVGFAGVNMRLEPGQLQPGFVASAKNKRFNNGVAEPRYGIKKVMWANDKNSGTAPNIGLSAYSSVKGVGTFNDPNGDNWLLIATQSSIYAVREGNPTKTLNTGMTNTADCTFVQCFNNVILFRGEDLSPLQMADINTGFIAITQTSSDTEIDENDSDGTETIPNANNGIFFQNRLLIPHSRDLVAASDFLNYTRYQPVLSNFRVNQGSEDFLVALWKFDASTILCFKESSVYAVRNIYGNLSDIFLDEISRGYGLKSSKAVVTVGKDIWFLSDQRGVVSLAVSESGKLQGVDAPVSEPIQPLIDRINWAYADKSAAAWHNNKYYLAVPIDGSTTNNAILVYDFRNQAWSGFDQSSEIDGLTDFVTFKYQGAKRLFFMANGFLNLYDDPNLSGFVDETVDTSNSSSRNISHTQISDELVSRGYKCGAEDMKRFQQANVTVSTNGVVGSSGGIDITALFDGVEETHALVTNKRFDRAKYRQPFDKGDFDGTNSLDDYGTAFREDYSTDLKATFTVTCDAITTTGDYTSSPISVLAIAGGIGKGSVITFSGGGVFTMSADAVSGATQLYGTLATSPIGLSELSTSIEGVDIGDNGIIPDAHQESIQKNRLNKSGRYAQLKISNDLGRAKVVGTAVSALPGKTMVTERL